MAERVLRTIDAGGRPVYQFVEKDEHTILLRDVDEPGRYLVVDKAALAVFASTFRDLAAEFGRGDW